MPIKIDRIFFHISHKFILPNSVFYLRECKMRGKRTYLNGKFCYINIDYHWGWNIRDKKPDGISLWIDPEIDADFVQILNEIFPNCWTHLANIFRWLHEWTNIESMNSKIVSLLSWKIENQFSTKDAKINWAKINKHISKRHTATSCCTRLIIGL